jgi:hypothetical protein
MAAVHATAAERGRLISEPGLSILTTRSIFPAADMRLVVFAAFFFFFLLL